MSSATTTTTASGVGVGDVARTSLCIMWHWNIIWGIEGNLNRFMHLTADNIRKIGYFAYRNGFFHTLLRRHSLLALPLTLEEEAEVAEYRKKRTNDIPVYPIDQNRNKLMDVETENGEEDLIPLLIKEGEPRSEN